MTLASIVAKTGGEHWSGGHQALIPRPNAPATDRSVSLRLHYDDANLAPRVVVHCFGGGSWQDVLDHLRDAGLVDANNRLLEHGRSGSWSRPSAPPPSEIERIRAARQIWDAGRPVENTPSAIYAKLRKVRRQLPGPDVIRHSSVVPLRVYQPAGSATKNATLLAITSPEGEFAACEIHYLNPNGRKASELKIPKKTVAPIPVGSAIRIDDPSTEMLVGEGFWTSLSASERFSLPCWALTSTSRLRYWKPPQGVKRVLIAADNGADGRASAAFLENRLISMGIRATSVFPDHPDPKVDWGDLAPPLDQPPVFQLLPWAA
jgi:putative DNA primase/helicase